MTGTSWPPPSAQQTKERRQPHLGRTGLRLSGRLAGVIVLAASALVVPSGSASADGIPTQIDAAAVDQFLSRELTAASIPGAAVAITRGDQVLHVRGYGFDSHHVPVTDRTLFRIASLSKSFTSLAVLQLVDAGKVSLDDSVAEHLPEFRPADPRGADITVRQLLDQTSGLADREVHDLNRHQPATLTEATTSLSSARLVAAPGTQFNYHNPNYQVAARLVEVLSGETFENYLRTHVFGLAGMPASSTTNTDDQPVAGLADGHVIAYGQPVATPAPHAFGAGSGDVVSSAADMARWLIVHANGGRAADGTRVVSEHSLRELHTASAPSGFALGWDTDGPAGAPTRLVHSGSLLTYSAYQAVLPKSGYGVALLFNSGSALMLEQTAIFYGLLHIVEGTDSTPSGPRFHTSTLDVLLGCLTLAVLILGASRFLTSRRRDSRHAAPSPVRTMLRLIPNLGVLALGVAFRKIVGYLLGGRDVSWLAAAYGWPALVAFVLAAMVASAVSLIATVWQLTGPAERAQAAEAGSPRQGSVAMTCPIPGRFAGRPSPAKPIRRYRPIRTSRSHP
jgi:CubicO group peptidase (beta-lactamase class C family)